jgi:hypothetical protein
LKRQRSLGEKMIRESERFVSRQYRFHKSASSGLAHMTRPPQPALSSALAIARPLPLVFPEPVDPKQAVPSQASRIVQESFGPNHKRGVSKPLVRSAIYKIFTKPFYYGWFEYPHGSGQWYQGKHEPMITEAEYDRVQALLGRNGNPRAQSQHEFAFTGLIRCGDCGRAVTAEEKHQVLCGYCKFKFAYRRQNTCPRCETTIEKMENPLFLHYTYYHCSKSRRPLLCSQKCVTGLELEKQINEHLARISISQQFKDWAIKYPSRNSRSQAPFRVGNFQNFGRGV